MKRLIAVISPILILFAGCGYARSPEAMAEGLCECMQPMAESMAVIKELSARGETADLEAAMNQLDNVAGEVDACMTELERQYGEALTNEETAIKTAMAQQCPEVAAAMEEANALF